MNLKKQTVADLSLIFVTLCWGISYYLMDIALGDMSPFTLNAYRFLIAFIIAGTISFNKIKNVSRETLKYSFLVGLALFFVYMCVTFGVKNTTLSNAGFLCALTVILTPLFEVVFLKKKLNGKIEIAAVMSLIGIVLLTLKDDFSINKDNIVGDILCIGCAVFYAIDLLLTEKAVSKKEVSAYQLGVFQLLVTGVFNLIAALTLEKPSLPSNGSVWGAVIFLSIFCTGLAFIIQAVAQKYTKASRVGIIFSLEPVFAAVVAYIFAAEVLSFKGYLGAVIMIASLFIMESDFKFLMIKKRK